MGLFLYKQQTGAYQTLFKSSYTSRERWGSVQLIVPSSDTVLLVKRQLGAIQEPLCWRMFQLLDEWMRDQWKL